MFAAVIFLFLTFVYSLALQISYTNPDGPYILLDNPTSISWSTDASSSEFFALLIIPEASSLSQAVYLSQADRNGETEGETVVTVSSSMNVQQGNHQIIAYFVLSSGAQPNLVNSPDASTEVFHLFANPNGNGNTNIGGQSSSTSSTPTSSSQEQETGTPTNSRPGTTSSGTSSPNPQTTNTNINSLQTPTLSTPVSATLGAYPTSDFSSPLDPSGTWLPIPNDGSKSHSTPNLLAIVLGILAGLLVLAMIVFLWFRWRRRRQEQCAEEDMDGKQSRFAVWGTRIRSSIYPSGGMHSQNPGDTLSLTVSLDEKQGHAQTDESTSLSLSSNATPPRAGGDLALQEALDEISRLRARLGEDSPPPYPANTV